MLVWNKDNRIAPHLYTHRICFGQTFASIEICLTKWIYSSGWQYPCDGNHQPRQLRSPLGLDRASLESKIPGYPVTHRWPLIMLIRSKREKQCILGICWMGIVQFQTDPPYHTVCFVGCISYSLGCIILLSYLTYESSHSLFSSTI